MYVAPAGSCPVPAAGVSVEPFWETFCTAADCSGLFGRLPGHLEAEVDSAAFARSCFAGLLGVVVLAAG